MWARQVGALLRASLITAMQYRSEFVFDGLTGLLRTVSTVAPLWLVFGHVDALAGWTLPQAGLVVSLFLVLSAMEGGIVEPNLGEVVESVRTGSLDLVLVKPADAQLLVSLRKVAPARIWDLLGALAVGAWAQWQLGLPDPVDAAVAVALLGAGLAAMYGLWLLAVCAAFWFVRVDNLRFLLSSIADAGRWPVSVFRGWVRWVLTFVVPVGLITTFPVEALRGAWDGRLVLTAFVAAGAFAVGSRLAWKRSLAAYTSASS